MHRFRKLAVALATAALAAGLTMAGTGTAHAAASPPAGPGTWAEIFAPEINSNGITLCADNFGSTAQGHNLQLWRCHGYASNGTPQRWQFSYLGQYLGGSIPEYRIANVGSGLCIGLDPNRVRGHDRGLKPAPGRLPGWPDIVDAEARSRFAGPG